MSPYRIALDETTTTVHLRAKYFRNLIVAVVALSAGSIGWALFSRTLAPLSGLLLLLPACGLFFILDGRILNRWRSRLFALWIKKDIDFWAVCETVDALPKLPKETVRGMLATLPSSSDLIEEQRISPVTREAAAATVSGAYAGQIDKIIWKTAAAAIASASIAVAATCRAWQPLSALLLLISLPPLKVWLKRRRSRILGEKTLIARSKPEFNHENYQDLVAAWDNNYR